jgi:DNA-binding Lrp family transcriptional regulator
LKGTSREIYRLLLKNDEPLGIREVQRALNLSSPSVAQYHLNKLERAGLLKREKGNYTVNKVLLENCVKISRFLIPRYLFYSVFAAVILILELTWLRPVDFSREYFFSTAATAIFVVIFCYETAKAWRKGSL